MSKLREKKLKNERSILDAAFLLFSTKGYESTSISDIVEKSGLARGTFYNYFNNKEEIWNNIVDGLLEKINNTLNTERDKADNIYSSTYNSFISYVEILYDESNMNFLILNQAILRNTIFSGEHLNSIYGDIEDDLRFRPFYTKLNEQQIKLTSIAMVSTAIELIFQNHVQNLQIPKDELAKYFTKLFIGGYEEIIK